MNWSPPHLSELPSWTRFRRVALDTETCDPDLTKMGPGVRRGAYIVGVSFALDDGTSNCPAFYLPLRHAGGGNYHCPDMAMEYLREQAKYFTGDLAGANLPYDLDFLAEVGVEFQPRHFRDIQVSGPLLDEPNWNGVPNKMSLEAQAARMGLPGKDEAGLLAYAEQHGLHPKADLWKMPAGVVAQYAMQDVRAPLQVLRRHERDLEAQDLWPLYDLESDLLPVLVKMRRMGVRVDTSKLEEISSRAAKREREAMREVSRLSGVQVDDGDTNTPAALAKCLQAEGHVLPKTPKSGKDSVTAGWLRATDTKLCQAILEARRWNKIRTTFCESILAHQVKGRIHCTFNQLRQEQEDGEMKGAAYGRCSSSNPNLQQQPARDPDIGPLWRSIYLPDEGGEWACLDYSGQEPRWITHYAERVANDKHCLWPESVKEAARAAAKACRTDPNWDNHMMMARMMYDRVQDGTASKEEVKQLRGNAKTIFLGLCYGMGSGKLARSLGLPTEWINADWADGKLVEVAGPEGEALLDRFHQRVPYVRQLTKAAKAKAEKVGYILTALGRRCRFPRDPQTGRIDWAHKSLNRLIQGTSADQMKLAMVAADRANFRLQLQIHDELDFTFYDMKQCHDLAKIMIEVLPCDVPVKVDIETGPNWGNLK